MRIFGDAENPKSSLQLGTEEKEAETRMRKLKGVSRPQGILGNVDLLFLIISTGKKMDWKYHSSTNLNVTPRFICIFLRRTVPICAKGDIFFIQNWIKVFLLWHCRGLFLYTSRKKVFHKCIISTCFSIIKKKLSCKHSHIQLQLMISFCHVWKKSLWWLELALHVNEQTVMSALHWAQVGYGYFYISVYNQKLFCLSSVLERGRQQKKERARIDSSVSYLQWGLLLFFKT